MLDDITLPTIAIAGGSLLLVLVLGIFWFATRELARRRRARLEARRTSFHAVVIDPRIAELGRAAFEDLPSLQPPRRLARGSTPGITAYTPYANDWGVPTAPSVTARMRAAASRR